MAGKKWTRHETLVALNVYCCTPFGRLHHRNPDIIQIAESMGRTPSSLSMKCCNLASLDPVLQGRGISGLSGASNLDRSIWHEFESDPESISFESERALAATTRREMQLSEKLEWEDVQGLEREAITKVRVNQQFFRSMVLAGYQSQCAVCRLPLQTLLVASHIIPWSVDKTQRMNPKNGLCLCTLHDKAFDRGLLSINEEFMISIHEELTAAESLPIIQSAFMAFNDKPICLPDRWHPEPSLLRRHNELHGGNAA